MDYVPEWTYLQKKSFDISNVAIGKADNDFTGRLIVKKWNGNETGRWLFSKGSPTKKLKFHRRENTTANTLPLASSTSNTCQVEVCYYTQQCWAYYAGDVFVKMECDEWQLDYCYYEDYECNDGGDGEEDGDPCAGLTDEDCACEVYGVGCGDGDGDNECSQEDIDQVIQEFSEYAAIKSPATVSHHAATSIEGSDPIVGDFTWTVIEAEVANWKIRANTDFKYYNTRYFNINLMRYENIFDLFYFKTGNGYYVGSNSFITSTYTTITPTTSTVINNNTTNPTGISRVRGIVEHVSNVKIKLPFCGDLALRHTDEVDNSCEFHPK